jgi:hypothetical protein
MAYMNQQRKKELTPGIKAVLKKYGYKGSIAVHNHSTLVFNIKEVTADFIGMANARNKEIAERRNQKYYPCDGYVQVNQFYPEFYGEAETFIEELVQAMKGTMWYDNSDAMIDYFETAYYIDINVGQWNKPYVCTSTMAEAA